MRAGLATIHQTLTSEASVVLNQSVAEAGRRNHGQVTPIHVAATLLSSPTGLLSQACIESHPDSSHPLQCRALDLCFRVALDRLSALRVVAPGTDPPISNALHAVLKRAHAQQRRGSPEQQQPLLAVKVELKQLVISILDDPSVSRVMKEASFCSPAVKATIEQSLLSSNARNLSVDSPPPNPKPIFEFRSLGSVPIPVPVPVPGGQNMYINPKLQKQSGTDVSDSRQEELRKIADIMSKTKKRNPILLSESEPELLVKEVLKKANNTLKIIRLDKERILESLGTDIPTSGEVIIDAGNLKWLVEQPSPFVTTSGVATEAGKKVVAVVGKVLRREAEGSKVWLIGYATCETFLRCHVYFPIIESLWDLQPVSVTGNFPSVRTFPVKNLDDNLPLWLRKVAPPAMPPPTSFVRTDLALGLPKDSIASKAFNSLDEEFIKKIRKALSRQQDAVESVVTTITQCRLGNGRRRGDDIWLLFTGPDVSGKRKMVSALSEAVCGAEPTVVRFGAKPTTEMTCSRKPSINQIVDAIRRNPFSVVLLENIDEADTFSRSSIKWAIEKGCLSDSSGREFSLGRAIFILTANWLPDDFPVTDGFPLNEKRLARLRNGNWNLRASLSEKNTKRHAKWLLADLPIKQKKAINLNEAADDDNSDLTDDDSKEERTLTINKVLSSSAYSFSRELKSHVDGSVVFKPLDSVVLRRDVAAFVANKFASIMGDEIAIQIEDDALEVIVCGVWLGWLDIDEWYETALLRVISRLKSRFSTDTGCDPVTCPIRVELDDEFSTWHRRDATLRSASVSTVGF